MSDAIAGAVDAMRMLKDGTMAVVLHFQPSDRAAVMQMMGEPGASIACVRLKDGHAAVPAPTAQRDTRGPLCKEACDLGKNATFHQFLAEAGYSRDEDGAKIFILSRCHISSRKELDTSHQAAILFQRFVRHPFQQWLRKQGEAK